MSWLNSSGKLYIYSPTNHTQPTCQQQRHRGAQRLRPAHPTSSASESPLTLSEAYTTSNSPRRVTAIPTAGPLTTATRGLGKSMKQFTKFLQTRRYKSSSAEHRPGGRAPRKQVLGAAGGFHHQPAGAPWGPPLATTLHPPRTAARQRLMEACGVGPLGRAWFRSCIPRSLRDCGG